MSGVPAAFSSESMRAEKRNAAANSLLAALAITGLKVFVGITTGSLGILSEAAHSALDLVAATITLVFGGPCPLISPPMLITNMATTARSKISLPSSKPALLLITCVVIIYEAFKRLFFHHVEN